MFTPEELEFLHRQMQLTARQAQQTLQMSAACMRKVEIMSRPEEKPLEVETNGTAPVDVVVTG